MALKLFDGVWETTSTPGTGAVTLTAKAGLRRFGDVCTHGDTEVVYLIAWDGGGFEHGLGTYNLNSGVHSLARNTVLANHLDTLSFIDLPAGPKEVLAQVPATRVVLTGREQTFTENQKFAEDVRLLMGDDAYWWSTFPGIVHLVSLGQEFLRLDGPNGRALLRLANSTSVGPKLRQYHERATPAANDEGGRIEHSVKDAAGSEIPIFDLTTYATTVTAGNVEGRATARLAIASALTDIYQLRQAGLCMSTSRGLFTGGKTASDTSVAGAEILSTGVIRAIASGVAPLEVDRKTSDGDAILIKQAGTQEGGISIAGNTVTYGTFLAEHWSLWGTGSKPKRDPKPGTLLETVDEICDFKDYLPKVRIAQPGTRRLYGTFAGYNERNQIKVHALGAGPWVRFKGRIRGGDLLTISDEPGVACAQEDDIVRRSTLGWAPVGDELARDGCLPIVHGAG